MESESNKCKEVRKGAKWGLPGSFLLINASCCFSNRTKTNRTELKTSQFIAMRLDRRQRLCWVEEEAAAAAEREVWEEREVRGER